MKNIITDHKLVSSILILFILGLWALPLGINWAATDWLKKNGAEARINDIDFNPFTGYFAINGLSMKTRSGNKSFLTSLRTNISMLGLLKKRVIFESIEIQGLRTTIEQKHGIYVVGIPISDKHNSSEEKDSDTGQSGLEFGIQKFDLLDSSLGYSGPEGSYDAKIKEISLANILSFSADQVSHGTLDIKFNNSPISADFDFKAFSKRKEFKAKIKSSHLSLKAFAKIAGPFISGLRGSIDLDTNVSLLLDNNGKAKLNQSGYFAINALKAKVNQDLETPLEIDNLSVSWKGETNIDLSKNFKPSGLQLKGKLTNGNLDFNFPQSKIKITHNGLEWEGSLRAQAPWGNKSFKSISRFSLNNLKLINDSIGLKLVDVGSADIEGINLDGLDNLKIPHIAVKKLKIASHEQERGKSIPADFLSTSEINIEKAELSDQVNLLIDKIALKDLDVNIYRNKLKKLPLVVMVKKSAPPLSEKKERKTTDQGEVKQAMIFKINLFEITGRNLINVRDETTSPKFQKKISIEKFLMTDLDSGDIHHAAQVYLAAKTAKDDSIDIKGDFFPFAPKLNAKLKGKIQNLNLSGYSPYSSQYLGYNVKTGKLFADIDFKVKSGKLDVNNTFILKNIQLTPDDQDKIDKLTKEFTMPLDYALSIIRDEDNNVTLSIPITGDLANPDFNLNDIIAIATKKALKIASISLLKNLLQPYGTLITAAQLAETAGKYITRISLDPVFYTSGSLNYGSETEAYLEKIKKILNDKKNLNLSICGISVPSDLPDKNPEKEKGEFISIAVKRANTIKSYLTDHGIDPTRLFLCNGEVDLKNNARPRVDLAL